MGKKTFAEFKVPTVAQEPRAPGVRKDFSSRRPYSLALPSFSLQVMGSVKDKNWFMQVILKKKARVFGSISSHIFRAIEEINDARIILVALCSSYLV